MQLSSHTSIAGLSPVSWAIGDIEIFQFTAKSLPTQYLSILVRQQWSIALLRCRTSVSVLYYTTVLYCSVLYLFFFICLYNVNGINYQKIKQAYRWRTDWPIDKRCDWNYQHLKIWFFGSKIYIIKIHTIMRIFWQQKIYIL